MVGLVHDDVVEMARRSQSLGCSQRISAGNHDTTIDFVLAKTGCKNPRWRTWPYFLEFVFSLGDKLLSMREDQDSAVRLCIEQLLDEVGKDNCLASPSRQND